MEGVPLPPRKTPVYPPREGPTETLYARIMPDLHHVLITLLKILYAVGPAAKTLGRQSSDSSLDIFGELTVHGAASDWAGASGYLETARRSAVRFPPLIRFLY